MKDLNSISKEIGFTPIFLIKDNMWFHLADSRAFSHWPLAIGCLLIANSQNPIAYFYILYFTHFLISIFDMRHWMLYSRL